jgi:ankyrin repeat protein
MKEQKNSELLLALYEENVVGVQKALRSSSLDDLNLKDQHGNTPLLISLMTGNLILAKILLDHGANIRCSSRVRPKSRFLHDLLL